jgi:hypothetical protein
MNQVDEMGILQRAHKDIIPIIVSTCQTEPDT